MFVDSVKLEVNAGKGGNGQTGIAGGQGGFAAGYATELTSGGQDTHCFKATAGGAGAPGGGGGAGAGGLAGRAYGMVFVCNRSDVSFFDSVEHVTSCGFNVPTGIVNTPTDYASTKTYFNGESGGAGSPGTWLDDANNLFTGPNKYAKYRSMGGNYGTASTNYSTTRATGKAVEMVKF